MKLALISLLLFAYTLAITVWICLAQSDMT